MPARYHSFRRGGLRFVVIDGSEEALFSTLAGDAAHRRATERLAALRAACAVNAQTWNGGVGEAPFAWLSAALDDAAAAGEKVVVMGHYPLYPENEPNPWAWQRMVDRRSAERRSGKEGVNKV